MYWASWLCDCSIPSIRDAQLIHAVSKGIGIDAQQFRCTAGTVDLAIGLLQYALNMLSDDVIKVIGGITPFLWMMGC